MVCIIFKKLKNGKDCNSLIIAIQILVLLYYEIVANKDLQLFVLLVSHLVLE